MTKFEVPGDYEIKSHHKVLLYPGVAVPKA